MTRNPTKPKQSPFRSSLLKGLAATALLTATAGLHAADIIYDAEFQKIQAQYADQWAQEDQALDAKLAELKAKHGKAPNIIYFMWDDAAYGRVGHPMLSKITGMETPTFDKIARDGMIFTRMYTEPSCTPTRVATLTGRHPIRSGLTQVVFPVHAIGMPQSEVTIAEVLKEAGYNTGFFGKYHVGDIDGSYPHQNGFDECLFTIYNQFGSQFFNKDGEDIGATFGFTENQQDKLYTLDKKFRNPSTVPWAAEGKAGEKAKQFNKDYSYEEQLRYIAEVHKRSLNYIKENANKENPFFMCYWFHGPNVAGVHRLGRTGDSSIANGDGDGFHEMDEKLAEMLTVLEEQGISENTLIIVMADNGPMLEFTPHMSRFGIYRGGKGSFTEGGVRVPAFAYWPGVIPEGSVAGDIIHVTDLYTTFARLGGGMEHIPTDRVIDGVDQTALILNGDTHGRRDYVHIYTGPVLAATVKQQVKRHWIGERPGLAGKSFFDLYRDPGEEEGRMAQFLWAWEPFDSMKARHQLLMEEYPNKPTMRGKPFEGIELLPNQTFEVKSPYFN